MSSDDGISISQKSLGSPSAVSPTLGQASQALSDLRLSLDSEGSTSTSPSPVHSNGVNGHVVNGTKSDEGTDSDVVARLELELERTREERETLATQYRNLLAKLTTMRTTLGDRLKQDAEELDRREQLVQHLTAQNDDLSSTIETLKEELVSSNNETERVSNELDTMRNRAFQENAQESLLRERELREMQTELEGCRMERDEWERAALQEKVVADEAKSAVETLERDLELEREAREREAGALEAEREKSQNLQSVLQDFQAAKDHELRQAVKDYDSQLTQATQSLAEYKHRALTAELQLEESYTNTSKTAELEKEVKDKNLLIRKLRHEAVILNEHLMEALRRLRRNSTDTNVDRRLVTNILLSFLTTDRADPKRFEMLSLLASILSWTDPEREKAGLQRAQTTSKSSLFWSKSSTSTPNKGSTELDKTDETESFSRLWVEFLLTEANSGEPPSSESTPRKASLPSSPTLSPRHPLSPTQKPRRLSSSPATATASLTNLTLDPPPSRKGKERARDGP